MHWCLAWAGDRGVAVRLVGVSVGGDKNVLKLEAMMGCTGLTILKTTELYTLKFHFMVYKLYISL